MTDLSVIRVTIQGDSSDLQADLQAAKTQLAGFEAQTVTAGQKTGAMGGAFKGLGKMSNQTRGKIQQVSYQVQDMATQFAMGTRSSIVLGQQLPQLAGAFGAVGAAIGVVAAIGFPLLGLAMAGSEEEVLSFDDSLEELQSSISALNDAIRNNSITALEALREKYGEVTAGVQELIQAQGIVAGERTARALQSAIQLQTGALTELVQAYDIAESSAARFGNNVMGGESAARLQALQRERELLAQIAEEYGVSEDAARGLVDAYRALQNATNLDDQIDAMEAMRAAVLSSVSATSDLDQAALDFLGSLNEVIDAAYEAARGLEALPDPIIAAQIEADILAGKLQAIANSFAGEFAGLEYDTNPDGKGFGLAGEGETTSDRRGGGGGASNPLLDQLEDLRETLATETELLQEAFAEQTDILAQAREQQLIDQEEFQQLSLASQQEYADAMNQITAAQKDANLGAFESMFGGLSRLMNSENEKLFKIGKAAAIAESLVSTYRGATKALELPFPQNLAAMGAVLANGFANIAAIKSTTFGGGGGAGAGGASTAAPTQPTNIMNVSLQGSNFSQSSVRDLLSQINEATADGGRFRVTTV